MNHKTPATGTENRSDPRLDCKQLRPHGVTENRRPDPRSILKRRQSRYIAAGRMRGESGTALSRI